MSETDGKVHVAIYCRLSEEDRNKQSEDDESNSIQNQKAMLSQYALERGWKIYKIFSDEDYSGASVNRPEFQSLLRDAEEGRFNTVLCKSQSRFTRDAEIVEKYIHRLFPMWGIRFLSVADNADTANKGNKKSRQINALVNEWYLEDLSNNVRAGLTIMRQQGKHIGGKAPYGYAIDPKDRHHLIVDEEAAAVVRRIFDLFISGEGKQRICTILNREGVPSPSAYKMLKGINCNGRQGSTSYLWKCQTVSLILNNEMYIGNMVQGRHSVISYKIQKMRRVDPDNWIIVPGTHDAVIDLLTWQTTQKLMRSRTRQGAGGTVGLFTGFVKCKCCGYSLATNKNHGRRYMLCPSRRADITSCEGCCISERELEQIVLEQLKSLMSLYFDEELTKKNMKLDQAARKDENALRKSMAHMEAELEAVRKAKVDAYLDKTKGVISEEDFGVITGGLLEKERAAEKSLRGMQEELGSLKRRQEKRKTKEQILEEYVGINTLNRGIITSLIDYIEVGKRTCKKEHPYVRIHWNF